MTLSLVRPGRLEELPTFDLEQLGGSPVMPPPLAKAKEALQSHGGGHYQADAKAIHRVHSAALPPTSRLTKAESERRRGWRQPAVRSNAVALGGPVLGPQDLIKPTRPEKALLQLIQGEQVDQLTEVAL